MVLGTASELLSFLSLDFGAFGDTEAGISTSTLFAFVGILAPFRDEAFPVAPTSRCFLKGLWVLQVATFCGLLSGHL